MIGVFFTMNNNSNNKELLDSLGLSVLETTPPLPGKLPLIVYRYEEPCSFKRRFLARLADYLPSPDILTFDTLTVNILNQKGWALEDFYTHSIGDLVLEVTLQVEHAFSIERGREESDIHAEISVIDHWCGGTKPLFHEQFRTTPEENHITEKTILELKEILGKKLSYECLRDEITASIRFLRLYNDWHPVYGILPRFVKI